MAHALRYLIALLWWATALAGAQSSPSSIRFTVFSARPLQDVAFLPRPGASTQKIVFYPTARSPRYEYQGAMPLKFVDATGGAVVAEATIPSDLREVCLIFLPAESSDANGSALRFRIAVLDDSTKAQPLGSLTIVNLSGLALSGNVGAAAVVLREGLNAPLPIARSAKISFRAAVKSRTYQSYADTLELNANERALLLLFPPYYKGSLEAQARLLLDRPGPTKR